MADNVVVTYYSHRVLGEEATLRSRVSHARVSSFNLVQITQPNSCRALEKLPGVLRCDRILRGEEDNTATNSARPQQLFDFPFPFEVSFEIFVVCYYSLPLRLDTFGESDTS